MQMRKEILPVLIIMMIFTVTGNAQLTINGEFRPRGEIRNGYKILKTEGDSPAYTISQRSRIGIFYQKKNMKTGFSFQDVRVWGDESLSSSTGVFGNQASVDVNEAWVEFSFQRHSKVKIGRQNFQFDDARLLAKRNWNQYSVSYDAILYGFSNNNWTADVAVSLNNETSRLFGNEFPSFKMKTLNFVRISKQISESILASITGIASGSTPDENSETVYIKGSYGINFNFQGDPLEIKTSMYYQNGKNFTGTEVNAWNLNLLGQYNIMPLVFKVGASVLSGDNPDDNKNQLFDLLYGARHSYYGMMDYFSNLPKSTSNGGLVDVFAGISVQMSPKTQLSADYHYFSLQQPVPDPGNIGKDLNKPLASEIDFTFKVNFLKEVNLTGGYSFILPTGTLEIVQGIEKGKSKFSSWAWLMLTVKPVLFDQGN